MRMLTIDKLELEHLGAPPERVSESRRGHRRHIALEQWRLVPRRPRRDDEVNAEDQPFPQFLRKPKGLFAELRLEIQFSQLWTDNLGISGNPECSPVDSEINVRGGARW